MNNLTWMVGAAVFAACGGGPKRVPLSNHAAAAIPPAAPVLDPAWGQLAGRYSVDLDGDGTLEQIVVAGPVASRTLTIDGQPQACGEAQNFSALAIVDLDPATPGLEVYGEQFIADADYQHCYFYKHNTMQSLALYDYTVEGKLLLVSGTCDDKPTVYERVADGFVERKELAAGRVLPTSCCEGEDCP